MMLIGIEPPKTEQNTAERTIAVSNGEQRMTILERNFEK